MSRGQVSIESSRISQGGGEAFEFWRPTKTEVVLDYTILYFFMFFWYYLVLMSNPNDTHMFFRGSWNHQIIHSRRVSDPSQRDHMLRIFFSWTLSLSSQHFCEVRRMPHPLVLLPPRYRHPGQAGQAPGLGGNSPRSSTGGSDEFGEFGGEHFHFWGGSELYRIILYYIGFWASMIYTILM